MTDLVSLFFVAIIPIDSKITNSSLYLFIYFFCNNYNIGELTSTTSKERMTTNIIFANRHLHSSGERNGEQRKTNLVEP